MKVPAVDLAVRFAPYRQRLHEALDRVLDHGQVILGPEVGEFEQAAARYVGSQYAVAVANGTDALMLGLRALGVTGGEVITTAMSYLASTSSIALAGATPVFADVGPDLNLDVESVAAAITPATKAILVVHLGGNPARMQDLNRLAKSRGLVVIEDCAQAFGAVFGANAGNLSDLGAVSFHPLKNLGAIGDAGAIFTNDAKVAAHLRLARNHGHSSRDQCEFWSVNSRIDSLQAGFLSAMLADYPSLLDARRKQADRYKSALAGVVAFPVVHAGAQPSYNFFYILAERRDALQQYLIDAGVDAKIHYPIPIHQLKAARAIPARPLPRTEHFTQRILSLPLGPHIADDQLQFVIGAVKEFYGDA